MRWRVRTGSDGAKRVVREALMRPLAVHSEEHLNPLSIGSSGQLDEASQVV